MPEPEILHWLNLLLVPVVGLLLRIREDLASVKTLQAEHQRRLDRLEKLPHGSAS